jgi:hypothetical protein
MFRLTDHNKNIRESAQPAHADETKHGDLSHNVLVKTGLGILKYAAHETVHALPKEFGKIGHAAVNFKLTSTLFCLSFGANYFDECNTNNPNAWRDALIKSGVNFAVDKLLMTCPPIWLTIKACEILKEPADVGLKISKETEAFCQEMRDQAIASGSMFRMIGTAEDMADLRSGQVALTIVKWLGGTSLEGKENAAGAMIKLFDNGSKNFPKKEVTIPENSVISPNTFTLPTMTQSGLVMPNKAGINLDVNLKPIPKQSLHLSPIEVKPVVFEPPKLIPGVNFNIQAIQSGIHFGVQSTFDMAGFKIGVGISFSGLDYIVSERINRMIGCDLLICKREIHGEKYKIHIKSSGSKSERFDGKHVKMIVTDLKTGKHKEYHFELEKFELSHRKNIGNITEALENTLIVFAKEKFEASKKIYENARNNALNRHDFASAQKLTDTFFKKYSNVAGVSKSKDLNNAEINIKKGFYDVSQAVDEHNYAKAYDSCEKINDAELKAKLREGIAGNEKNHHMAVAADLLKNGEHQAAQDYVDGNVLASTPQDITGLEIKACAQMGKGDVNAAVKTLEFALSVDPNSKDIKNHIYNSYNYLINELNMTHYEDHKNKRGDLQTAMDGYAQDTGELFEKELSDKLEHIEKLKALYEKRKQYADEPNEQLSGVDSTDLQNEHDDYTNLKNQYYFNELKMLRYNAQISQMIFDLMSNVSHAAISLWFNDKNGKLTQNGLILDSGMKVLNSIASNAVQALSHYNNRLIDDVIRVGEPEPITGLALSHARYAMLGVNVFRDVLEATIPIVPVYFKPLAAGTVSTIDDYLNPAWQLTSAVGAMCLNPENFPVQLVCFPFEAIIKIPEVKRYLLGPDPRDYNGHIKYAVGKFLSGLCEKSKSNQIIQMTNYLNSYSEVASVMVKGKKDDEFIKNINDHYITMRVIQIYASACQAFCDMRGEWKEYIKKCLIQLKDEAIKFFENGNYQSSSVVWSKIKNILRCVNLDTHDVRQLYVDAYFNEYKLSNGMQIYRIAHDGNCLFNSISIYTNHTGGQLRQMSMDYIEQHREEMLPYITGNFDAYVQSMRTDGAWNNENFGEMQIRALEKILNRPIVIVNLYSYKINTELSGEPIFIKYNAEGYHYDGILMSGDPYFEKQYSVFLAREKHSQLEKLRLIKERHENEMRNLHEKQVLIAQKRNQLKTEYALMESELNALGMFSRSNFRAQAGVNSMQERQILQDEFRNLSQITIN